MRTIWVFMTAGLMALAGCAGESGTTQKTIVDGDSLSSIEKGEALTGVENSATVEMDSLVGVYKGTMPSADCDGVAVTLTLLAGQKYNMVYQAVGGKSMIVEINGVYERTPDLEMLALETPKGREKIYFKVLNGHEVMLADSTGKVDRGPLAKKYVLLKD